MTDSNLICCFYCGRREEPHEVITDNHQGRRLGKEARSLPVCQDHVCASCFNVASLSGPHLSLSDKVAT
jgi:hypothetical protein